MLKTTEKNRLGYACINMELNQLPKKKRVTTNRAMVRKTFDEKGIAYASELALQNCKDLKTILEWNVKNSIYFFRISSNIFPWASEYDLEELPDYEEIEEVMFNAGLFVDENNIRITSHPGPFNKLTSPKEEVVLNTIKDLEIHGKVHDLLGLYNSPYNKINIHVGASYGDKSMAIKNFCRNFKRLSESVRSRLTVENDDRPSLYSTKELYDFVYREIGIPIVFDYHHHKFRHDGMSELEALEMAFDTWGKVRPVVHYSQSRSIEYNDPSIKANAHSDSYWTPINLYDKEFDVMLECKHKEIGLFKMRELLAEKNNIDNKSL